MQFALPQYILQYLMLLSGKGTTLKSPNSVAAAAPGRSMASVKSSDVCNTPGCATAAATLIENVDESVNPCDDFYEFACGKWRREHPIPEDKSSIGKFAILEDRVQIQMRSLLEKDVRLGINSNAVNLTRSLYRACTNTTRLGEVKSAPLFAAISKLGGWPLIGQQLPWSYDLSNLIVQIKRDFGLSSFWRFSVEPDDKNSTRHILRIDQPRLTLSSRQYYLNDTKYGKILTAYAKWIQSTAALIAKDAQLPTMPNEQQMFNDVTNLILFEKKLANLTRDEEDRRNYTELYNLWTIGDLKATIRFVNWDVYFGAILPTRVRPFITDRTQILISEPKYLLQLRQLLAETDRRTLVNYAIWRIVSANVLRLDDRFLNVRQDFIRVLEGRESRPFQWKVCVDTAIGSLPKAAGALYVDRYFTEQDKQEAVTMINNLMKTYEEMIRENSWMDEQTKFSAVAKLHAIAPLIGYPDFIKDATKLDRYYKDLVVRSDGFYEMMNAIVIFEQNRELNKVIELVDRYEFDVSPAVVNAFYNPQFNTIVFPAAILQPPFFKSDFPKAVNYGAMGVIIGHELTHGFDDQGSQYDLLGNLHNWWSNTSSVGFKSRTKCIIDQYSNYKVEEVNMNVNGKLTQGENIADNGGVKESFRAYRKYTSSLEGGEEPNLAGVDKQMDHVFFLSYASIWCANRKPELVIKRILSDPHSPAEFRVMGPLANSNEFARAFNCVPGTPMNPLPSVATKCEVW